MTLPTGSTAVMARRAAGEIAADDARQALYRQLDYFPTPPWAARAGAELIRRLDPQAGSVWEPACGEGHMAAALSEYFAVYASDIHDHGFGDRVDFLSDPAAARGVDWIVTNPPFKVAPAFIRQALRLAKRGVAMLLRLPFLEGCERYELLHGASPLTVCAPFAERVPMTLGRWDPAAASATAYAWFIWIKGAAPMPIIGIPPGTRDRLWKADDAARFGWRAPAGLLEAMEAAR